MADFKYRVKFKCYWYNTGAADNHSYIKEEDFDTLEKAQEFRRRVNLQYDMSQKRVIYEHSHKPNEYEMKYNYWISNKDYEEWANSEDTIEVENGYIIGYGDIFKYYPEREDSI